MSWGNGGKHREVNERWAGIVALVLGNTGTTFGEFSAALRGV